jgi:STIP1 homology and U-box containing protein 1
MSTLRDLGNEHFKAGKYKEAEQLYTEAILGHSRADPKVFSNRALTRIRLQDWTGAEQDARKAIELHGPKNNAAMKSHYYLAQALLAMRHVGEALEEAKYAYSICLQTNDPSSETLSQFILRTKQAQWQTRETARLREMNDTLATVEGLLEDKLEKDIADLERAFLNSEIGETSRNEDRSLLEKEAEERRRNIRNALRDTEKPETVERVRYTADGVAPS